MTVISDLTMAVGGLIALLAGAGLVRFRTPYARFHAAGKASPVAFLVTAIGASIALGLSGAAYLGIAAVAMVLTLPVGVHLLFRAVHRTDNTMALSVDELAVAKAERR